MCHLVFSLQEFLKIVPGIILLPLSLYLGWKKVGTKIVTSISVEHQITLAPRISSIVLINKKDKPLVVFAAYAVINKEVYFRVETFNPPLVVKPLEATQIETEPYSELSIGLTKFEPDFVLSNKVEIYLALTEGIIKCKMANNPDLNSIPAFKKYRIATKIVNKFNGIVYNDDAAYAILYRIDSHVRTAIVDRSGFICRNWEFWFNMIPKEHMKGEETLKKYLEEVGFGKVVEYYFVHSLQPPQ